MELKRQEEVFLFINLASQRKGEYICNIFVNDPIFTSILQWFSPIVQQLSPQSQSWWPIKGKMEPTAFQNGVRAELIETTENNHQNEAPSIQVNTAILADNNLQYEDKKKAIFHDSEMTFFPLFLVLSRYSPVGE